MANVDPFAKVSVGDPFRFKALVHNAVIDLINERRIPGLGGGSRIPGHPENETAILVKNVTGQDIPQFGIVAISTPTFLQSANDQAFRSRHWWNGDTPTSSSIVAITQEPIAKGNTGTELNGRVGPAVMLGQTPAKVNVTDSAHTYCVPSTSTSTLDSATTGPIKLLWYDASGGSTGSDKWAKVLLLGDAPGAGGGSTGSHYYCKATGSATPTSSSFDTGVGAPQNGTPVEASMSSFLLNPGSHFSLTAGNRVKVLSAGDYRICVQYWPASGSHDLMFHAIQLLKNGSTVPVWDSFFEDATNYGTNSNFGSLNFETILSLSANDEISTKCWAWDFPSGNGATGTVIIDLFSLTHF